MPANIHPKTPPIPLPIKLSDRKSCDPNLLSSLDYCTIIASDTTIITARDKLVIIKRSARVNASSGSIMKMMIREAN